MAISVGDAVLKLGLDSSGFDKSIAEVQTKTSSAFQKLQKNIVPVTAGMAAVGAAGLKMIDTAREMNAQLAVTGLTIGKTEAEMRKLALETTNVTFPLKSVLNTFDLLVRAGVKTDWELKAVANAFDALADATGSSAEVVAEQLIPAYKLFGIELPKTSQEMDKFTWLTRNTTVDVSDFAAAMTYVAREGNTMGLELEDMVAIMAALEAKGVTGAAATMTFRTAITEAAKENKSLNDVLGISQEEIEKYKLQLDSATGITDDFAKAANTQYGIMDDLKQKWDELALVAGSFLTPLEPVLTGMTALSTVILALNVLRIPKLIALLGGAGLLGTLGAVAAALTGIYLAFDKFWDRMGQPLAMLLGLAIPGPGLAAFLKHGGWPTGLLPGGETTPAWPEVPSEFMEGTASKLAGIPTAAGANVTSLNLAIENFYGDEESKAALARYLEEELAKLQRLGG